MQPVDQASLTQSSNPAPIVWRLNNVAVAVHDLATMANWYGRVLGFTLVEHGRFDAVGADYQMIERDGVRLELVCRAAGAKVLVDRTAPPDHLDVLGWKALVLETGDLALATTALIGKGVDIVWADQQISASRRSTMIRDPEGNLINLFGPRLTES